MKKIMFYLIFIPFFIFSQEAPSEKENKLIAFFKDKDNLGFVILISIAFVGFSFKIVDVILKSRREKSEQGHKTSHGHHHHHHHHHHHKHHPHYTKRK